MNLEDAVRDLIRAREENAAAQLRYQTAMLKWEEEHGDLILAKINSETRLKDAKGAVQSAALEAHRATGIKKLFGGIGIRIYSGLKMVEDREREAVEYCKKFLPLAVRETVSKEILFPYLEGIMKAEPAAGLPSFVQKWERPTPTIPDEIKLNGEACSEAPAAAEEKSS